MKIIHKNKRIKFLSRNNNVNIQKTNIVTNNMTKIRTTLPPDIIQITFSSFLG